MNADELHIRIATRDDLDAVMDIVAQTVAQMRRDGNDQWDESYPTREVFAADVDAGALWVVESAGGVVGFVVADEEEPGGYADLPFSGEALVIHRFAVDTSRRRAGVASRLESHVCALARERGLDWVEVDTHSTNAGMQAFLEGRGFRKVGEMIFFGKDRPFCCYEKHL